MTTPRKVALLAAVVVLAVAAPAAANHVFSDVPASNVHHDAVGELIDAGITSGCAPGRFCPQEPVQRGQMATFLTRAGSAAFADESATTLVAAGGDLSGVPVTLEVTAPGSNGIQHVVLQGSVTVHLDGVADDCPCEVEAFVHRAGGGLQGGSSWAVLPGEAAGSGTTSVSLPVTWAVPQRAGAREEYRLAVFVDGTTTAGVRADGALTAVTAPFGDVR